MKSFVFFIITWALVVSVPRDNQAQVSDCVVNLSPYIFLGFSQTNDLIFKLLPEIFFNADMIN